MRSFGWVLLAMTLGCGSTNEVQTQTPILPLDALAVAHYATARLGVPLTRLAVDPSIAADLAALEDDGCYLDSTSPSPLPANSNTYAVTTTYSNCNSNVASAVTGTRQISVSIDDQNSITTLGSLFQLELVQATGAAVNLSSTTQASLSGNITTGNATRTYASTGTWTTPGASQGAVQNFNSTLALADTYDLTSQLPTGTTLSGTYAETFAGSTQGFTATYDNVILRSSQCCIPMGGSISEAQVFNDGSIDSTTWTFGSTCGIVSINGQSITINDCP